MDVYGTSKLFILLLSNWLVHLLATTCSSSKGIHEMFCLIEVIFKFISSKISHPMIFLCCRAWVSSLDPFCISLLISLIFESELDYSSSTSLFNSSHKTSAIIIFVNCSSCLELPIVFWKLLYTSLEATTNLFKVVSWCLMVL